MVDREPEESGKVQRRISRRALLVARYPLRLLRRSTHRFAKRPAVTKLRTVGLVLAVATGLVVYLAGSPAATGGASAGASTGGGGGTSLAKASTSTRGVTGTTINVVFPVVSLNSLAGKYGFMNTAEYGEQKKAIKFFVGQVNAHGGINGRKINAIIPTFTPTNATEQRSLCKDWTEGSPPVFAVVDGFGTWQGTNQLCVTQEGHTPLISAWTTVSTWTTKGAPYLWWMGADDTVVLQATVNWGISAGLLLGPGKKVGVVVGDRASDQAALHKGLLPDLRRAGVTPVVETLPSQTTETAATNADAPLVIQKLKAKGVNAVFPLIPFNAFFPLVNAAQQQSYFPKLLLSDYEQGITSALGLIPTVDETILNNQEGVTTETLGGVDDPRPESKGGYDPGVRACYEAWHKKYPQPVGKVQMYTLTVPNASGQEVKTHIVNQRNSFIEEQGPVEAWCTAVRLFATAAKNAGRNLNRRTFVEAMAKIKNFPGGVSPVLSYGPNKFYGPTQYQVVEIHNNNPTSSACDTLSTGHPQGTCWVVKQHWLPLPEG